MYGGKMASLASSLKCPFLPPFCLGSAFPGDKLENKVVVIWYQIYRYFQGWMFQLVKNWETPFKKLKTGSYKNDLNSHRIILSFTFLLLCLKIPQTSSIPTKQKTHKPCLKHEQSAATWAVNGHSVILTECFREDTQRSNTGNGSLKDQSPQNCLTNQGADSMAQATTVFYKVSSSSSQNKHESKVTTLCKLRINSRIYSMWARALEALRSMFRKKK